MKTIFVSRLQHYQHNVLQRNGFLTIYMLQSNLLKQNNHFLFFNVQGKDAYFHYTKTAKPNRTKNFQGFKMQNKKKKMQNN